MTQDRNRLTVASCRYDRTPQKIKINASCRYDTGQQKWLTVASCRYDRKNCWCLDHAGVIQKRLTVASRRYGMVQEKTGSCRYDTDNVMIMHRKNWWHIEHVVVIQEKADTWVMLVWHSTRVEKTVWLFWYDTVQKQAGIWIMSVWHSTEEDWLLRYVSMTQWSERLAAGSCRYDTERTASVLIIYR